MVDLPSRLVGLGRSLRTRPMVSPADTLSSCSTQRGQWNGKEYYTFRSQRRSSTPAGGTQRASSGSMWAGGRSTDCGRRDAEETQSIRHNEKISRETKECSRMRVGVRVRPAFASEMHSGYRPAVAIFGGTGVKSELWHAGGQYLAEDDDLIGSRCEGETGTASPRQAGVELRMTNWRQRKFLFDYAFDATSQQDEVYESLAAPVVEGCLAGLNGVILAYGQTASGKSHTMGILRGLDIPAVDHEDPSILQAWRSTAEKEFTGTRLNLESTVRGYRKRRTSAQSCSHNQVDPGVIPRALSRVFDRESRSTDPSATVTVSLLQIYNETVQDLLPPLSSFAGEAVGLNIRENPSVGFFVEGLREHAVRSHQEAAALINSGLQQRTTARTSKNEISSRSHTVLTITLEHGNGLELFPSASRAEAAATAKLQPGDMGGSKLVLVDLEGSERGKRPNAYAQEESEPERLREAGYINLSLSALGNVVAALGKPPADRPHTPFRDSKLTRILADTLGGNANAALIATVGPAPQDQAESLSTLLFASRCMRVRDRPARHDEGAEKEATLRLQAQLSSMRREFCRREALQQSRYETVVTRLTQELEYARNKVTSARASCWPADLDHRAPAAKFTTGEVPSRCSKCRASASLCDEESSTSNTMEHHYFTATPAAANSDVGRQTHGLKSTDGGWCPAVLHPGDCSDTAVGEITGSIRTDATTKREEGATAAVGREPVAREMLGAAVRTLEVVRQKGAEVIRQAREAREAGDTARQETTKGQSAPPAPLAEAGSVAEATPETDEHIPRMKRDHILQRLECLRELCERQWSGVDEMLSLAVREKNRMQEMLRTEAKSRRRQEIKARRLSGALKYLLDDGECARGNDLTPTPHQMPEERRGSEIVPASPCCPGDVNAGDQEQG